MESRVTSLPRRKNSVASFSTKPRKDISVNDMDTSIHSNVDTCNSTGSNHYKQQELFNENKRLKKELETSKSTVADYKNQMKILQDLSEVQDKYVKEAEARLVRLRQIEEENEKIKEELKEERKLKTEANDLAIELQRLLLEFESGPVSKKTSKLLGLEAKLIAKSTEDNKIFNSNVDVISKKMSNFCGSLTTTLNIMKNHQKERSEEIENIVRKLVGCCCYGESARHNAKENSDSKEVIDISSDTKDDMDTSGDDIGDQGTLATAIDNRDTSGEDKEESDNSGVANNDSGVSCFDPIEIDDQPEPDDSPNLAARKSIRQRRPSGALREYSVPREILEIHQGQKERHLEKKDDNLTNKCGLKHKTKKELVQKQASNSKLEKKIPCKLCKKSFGTRQN